LKIKEVTVAKNSTNNRSKLLNEALKEIDGEFVSFLDDDDVYYPNFAQVLIKKLLDDETITLVNGKCVVAWYKKYDKFYFVE